MTTSTWALLSSWRIRLPPWFPSWTPLPSSAISTDCPGPIVVLIGVTRRVLVQQAPVAERLRGRGKARQHHDLATRVVAARIDQGTLEVDRGGWDRRRYRPSGEDLADGRGPGRGVPRRVGRDALGLEAEEQAEIPIGKRQDEPAIVKHAIVAGVRPDVALVHVNVVDAMQAVDVAEFDVDRLVQVPVELGAERVDLAAGVLALIEIQRQQILQVVTARAARRRQRRARASSRTAAP